MKQRVNNLKDFLRKVKDLRGFGNMSSYQVVRDYSNLAQESAKDNLENIIIALSSLDTYNEVKARMISNISEELNQINDSQ